MLPEWRSSVILLVCCSLHLGEWLAFLLAATVSDWIKITIINSLIITPAFLILIYMDESPHWILSRTRNSERLRNCFEKLNRINSGNLDRDSIKSIVNVSISSILWLIYRDIWIIYEIYRNLHIFPHQTQTKIFRKDEMMKKKAEMMRIRGMNCLGWRSFGYFWSVLHWSKWFFCLLLWLAQIFSWAANSRITRKNLMKHPWFWIHFLDRWLRCRQYFLRGRWLNRELAGDGRTLRYSQSIWWQLFW